MRWQKSSLHGIKKLIKHYAEEIELLEKAIKYRAKE